MGSWVCLGCWSQGSGGVARVAGARVVVGSWVFLGYLSQGSGGVAGASVVVRLLGLLEPG